MMFRDEQYPLLLVLQANALREFAEQSDVPAGHVTRLAHVTGRGYHPPTSATAWQALYESLRKAGAFAEEGEIEVDNSLGRGVIGG